MNPKIKNISAREILDSRANPTVEARVELETGDMGIASVPSGASTGVHEAHELRDGDKSRYNGKGVLTAVKNINEVIRPALMNRNAANQLEIDREMIALDGSKNKSNLGANAILAVSLATAKAVAASEKVALYEYLENKNSINFPTPMFNLLNGGAHASNNVDIQEFMVVPHELPLPEAIRAGSEIYHTLGKILKSKGLATGVGDEGGFAPDLGSDEEAIDLLCTAITQAGYSTDKVGIALDVASSEWFDNGKYVLPKRGQERSRQELIKYYEALCDKYPIISIEDGLAEDDFDGWQELTIALGSKIMLVGDDLFVTNEERLNMGIRMGVGNAILIKPNQIGSLSETMSVIARAKEAGYSYIISHRSGETCDTSIADIAVATGAKFIKTGAPCRGERVAKYNRLLEIYDYHK
ncbi:MAG: phosphopyruvate hydratase [Clostridia bacterium]|nr:phosphopyruvate hydratase [Clostridia bacterium]